MALHLWMRCTTAVHHARFGPASLYDFEPPTHVPQPAVVLPKGLSSNLTVKSRHPSCPCHAGICSHQPLSILRASTDTPHPGEKSCIQYLSDAVRAIAR